MSCVADVSGLHDIMTQVRDLGKEEKIFITLGRNYELSQLY